MMGAFNIAPIITMILLGAGVVFILSSAKRNKRRRSTSKKRPIFLWIYGSVLVLGGIVYVLFPSPTIDRLEAYEGDDPTYGHASFYGVMDGDVAIDEIAAYKETDETYPLTSDTLAFTGVGAENYYETLKMLIVKDPSLEKEMNIETYQIPYIYEEKDLTKYVQWVNVGGNDETVTLDFPTEDAVLSMYDYSFPFKQFVDQDRRGFLGNGDIQSSSDQLVIVYIPMDVEPDVAHILNEGSYHIEMISLDKE